MSSRTLQMNDTIYDYLLANSLRESSIAKRLREETSGITGAGMQISPEQGQFMALLVSMLGCKRAIEVGTFTGYSALCVASALPPDGYLLACDVSEEWTSMGRKYWQEAGIADKIDLQLRPAIETLDARLQQGFAGSFDFAFIDADKANYVQYYERIMKLLRPGGVVAIDNVLWGGDVADPTIQDADTQAIRRLNQRVHGDSRVHLSMLPIGDGLTLVRKKTS